MFFIDLSSLLWFSVSCASISYNLAIIINFNFSRLLHLKYPELNEDAYASSLSREKRYEQLTAEKNASNMKDMVRILGNNVDDPWPIFSDKSSARVNTINLGEREIIILRTIQWKYENMFLEP